MYTIFVPSSNIPSCYPVARQMVDSWVGWGDTGTMFMPIHCYVAGLAAFVIDYMQTRIIRIQLTSC